MKKTILGLGLAAATLAALPSAASAQPWGGINARQDRLYARIDQGVRSGELNRREASRLRAQFTNIARLERDYRADGRLDRRERMELNRRFDALSARVYRNKHDRQYRG